MLTRGPCWTTVANWPIFRPQNSNSAQQNCFRPRKFRPRKWPNSKNAAYFYCYVVKKGPSCQEMYLIQKLKKNFLCVQTVQSRLKMVAAQLFLQRPNFVGQTGLGFWPGPGNSVLDVLARCLKKEIAQVCTLLKQCTNIKEEITANTIIVVTLSVD